MSYPVGSGVGPVVQSIVTDCFSESFSERSGFVYSLGIFRPLSRRLWSSLTNYNSQITYIPNKYWFIYEGVRACMLTFARLLY